MFVCISYKVCMCSSGAISTQMGFPFLYLVCAEFIDYISSFSSHEKYENGETYILGSLNASMCKAMRVKIIRK